MPIQWMNDYAERDGNLVFLHSSFVFHRRGQPQAGGTRVLHRFFLRSSVLYEKTSLACLRTDVLPSLVAAAHRRQTQASDKGSAAAPPLLPGAIDGPEDPIDPGKVFPLFEPHFMQSSNPGPTIFVKTPSLLFYHDTTARENCKAWLQSEILLLEMLHKNPHAHIVKYHGVVVEGDRISGFALERLTQNLDQRCHSGVPPLDVTKVINDIKDALTHLHSLGYCHNDVHVFNIMLKADDEAVLIDFDSCLRENAPLSKGTMPGWGDGSTISSRANDWACLRQVKDYLCNAFKKAP